MRRSTCVPTAMAGTLRSAWPEFCGGIGKQGPLDPWQQELPRRPTLRLNSLFLQSGVNDVRSRNDPAKGIDRKPKACIGQKRHH